MDILNILQGSQKQADSDLERSDQKSSNLTQRDSEPMLTPQKSSSKKPCKKCAKWKAIIDEGEALNAENNNSFISEI